MFLSCLSRFFPSIQMILYRKNSKNDIDCRNLSSGWFFAHVDKLSILLSCFILVTMAPEVIVGVLYNEQCDIFSWAIVFWQLLTKQLLPYGNQNKSRISSCNYLLNMNELCFVRIQFFFFRLCKTRNVQQN
jgi:hypothetical protein